MFRSILKNIIITASFSLALTANAEEVLGELELQAGVSITSNSSPIALSKNGRWLFSANSHADSISVSDTRGAVDTFKIKVGKNPRSIALIEKSKTILVANSGENTVSILTFSGSEQEDEINALDSRKAIIQDKIVTGTEPRSIVVHPSGRFAVVANSGQDTISLLDIQSKKVIHAIDLANSDCSYGYEGIRFSPRGLAISPDGSKVFVARYLSYVVPGGVQRHDDGKAGLVCELRAVKVGNKIQLQPHGIVLLDSQDTGFYDANGEMTRAFPNQLAVMYSRDNTLYLPNIAASPSGPQTFETITQAFVSSVELHEDGMEYKGALNLHLGGLDPIEGKKEYYFANPSAIEFTSAVGEGTALVSAHGSDLLVFLNVSESGALQFTEDQDSTLYVDLNDPDNAATSGRSAGKGPIGIAVDRDRQLAYVLNHISRNISVVDLGLAKVVSTIETDELPLPGSLEEILLVGEEMFYSSRGNFVSDDVIIGSARDRLSEKGRQSCASCHAEGLTDGIVWQFASGPRKTISVNGTFNPHDPSDQRIINASAIFDEVEDADFNTRLVSSPGWLEFPLPCIDQPPYDEIGESKVDPDHGLILGEWNVFGLAACSMNQFRRPNGGRPQPYVRLPGSDTLVKAHDALIDWQRLAVKTPAAPMTRLELLSNGAPGVGGIRAAAVNRGRLVFSEYGCQQCHGGGKWTKSSKDFVSPPDDAEIFQETGVEGVNQQEFLARFLNDIDSYNLGVPASGNYVDGYAPIGGVEIDTRGLLALGKDHNGDGFGNGYNTYSILGIHSSPPYYHNGACETIDCVVSHEAHLNAGGGTATSLTERQKLDLIEFIKSIDESTEIF